MPGMMTNLSTDELRLLIAVAGAAGAVAAAIVTAALKGVGYLVHRRVTGAADHEELDRQQRRVAIATALKTSGMAPEDVEALLGALASKSPAGDMAPSLAMYRAVGDDLGDAGSSNPALKARASAAFEVAEAKLAQAKLDLYLVSIDDEPNLLDEAHAAWEAHRGALMDAAGALYAGGTHAPLAGTLAGLAETERRIADVAAMTRERIGR